MTILKRLLPSHDIDALIGDIVEEAPRRSRVWYWSQLLAVLLVSSVRDMRSHPLLALRATLTGGVTQAAYVGAMLTSGRVIRVLADGGYYIGGHWLTLPHMGPPPPYDALTVLSINAFGFALSGWAVVRLHRAHGIAMAMPFLIVMTLLALVLLAILAMDTGAGTRPMSLHQFITIFGTMFAAVPGGILLGGYAATRPAERA